MKNATIPANYSLLILVGILLCVIVFVIGLKIGQDTALQHLVSPPLPHPDSLHGLRATAILTSGRNVTGKAVDIGSYPQPLVFSSEIGPDVLSALNYHYDEIPVDSLALSPVVLVVFFDIVADDSPGQLITLNVMTMEGVSHEYLLVPNQDLGLHGYYTVTPDSVLQEAIEHMDGELCGFIGPRDPAKETPLTGNSDK